MIGARVSWQFATTHHNTISKRDSLSSRRPMSRSAATKQPYDLSKNAKPLPARPETPEEPEVP